MDSIWTPIKLRLINHKDVIMNNQIRVMLILISLFIFPLKSFAEIKFSNATAKDIGRAYGFYIAQNHSLSEISQKYPSLSVSAEIVEKEFASNFSTSIRNMDLFMDKHAKNEWSKIKQQLPSQIANLFNMEQVSLDQAREFVDLVSKRAKGEIESPIIQTLLLFKPAYESNPGLEFIDGYKQKYLSDGLGKAKGVAFSIEHPITWIAKEAERPNIVQKFVSENGQGPANFLILIKELLLESGEKITEEDISEILEPKYIQSFIPNGGSYLNSGRLTLEGLPGFWMHYKLESSRVRSTVGMEVLAYTIYYNNKLIQIQGQLITSFNGESTVHVEFEKYEKLFDLMANSFIILNLYE